MSVVHLRHIRRSLEDVFRPFVDMADYATRPKEHQEDAFLTRAQAAFALVVTAKIEPAIAPACVVERIDDKGIDAVYFDPDEKHLFLVQSKWHKIGKGPLSWRT